MRRVEQETFSKPTHAGQIAKRPTKKDNGSMNREKPSVEEMKGALYRDNHHVDLHSKLLSWLL